MTWSKNLKGSFADIRDQLNSVASDVQATDAKSKESDAVREAHHMQAQVAVAAALAITAHAPFRAASDDEEDRDMTVSLSGSSEKDGSGEVKVSYKIGSKKLKIDRLNREIKEAERAVVNKLTKGSKKSGK